MTICTHNRINYFGSIHDEQMQLSPLGVFAHQFWIEIPVHFPFVKFDADFGWQSRYHEHIIRNDESYQRICQYIINNPSNWHEDTFYADWMIYWNLKRQNKPTAHFTSICPTQPSRRENVVPPLEKIDSSEKMPQEHLIHHSSESPGWHKRTTNGTSTAFVRLL